MRLRFAVAPLAGLAMGALSPAVAQENSAPTTTSRASESLDCAIWAFTRLVENDPVDGVVEDDADLYYSYMLYFMARYEGATGDPVGPALGKRVRDRIDVDAIEGRCRLIFDATGASLDAADQAMQDYERELRSGD